MGARRWVGTTALLGFALAGSLAAQAAAPKGATGQCTDGSYTTARTQARGCLKHGGVKTWFAAAMAPAATAPAATAPAAPSASASAFPKASPKGATGQCSDGSYTTAKTQAKGCLKHGGVKTWFAAATAPTAAAPAAVAPAASVSGPSAIPARATAVRPALAPPNPSDVWVNLSTKAYHCPGTRYYGTTRHGRYMSEADAKAAGFHPSYGKACS